MDAPAANQAVGSAVPGPGSRRWDIRYYYLLISALVLAVSTFIAFRQAPAPDAFTAWRWDDAGWWRYPIERNAYKRLPVLRGITALRPLPGKPDQLIAAVGPALLYSEDGGAHWSKARIDWSGNAPPPSTTASSGFLISAAIAGDMPEQYQQSSQQNYDAKSPQPTNSQYQYPNAANAPPPLQQQVQQKSIPAQAPQKSPPPAAQKTAPPVPVDIEETSADPSTLPIVALSALPNGELWALGMRGAVLHSADRGASWQLRALVPVDVEFQGALFTDIQFADTQNGWIAATQFVANTSDGGRRWNVHYRVPTQQVQTTQFIDAQHAWLIDARGRLHFSDNGGSAWRTLYGGSDLLQDLQFTDTQNGWALTDKGQLLSSADGGRSWQKMAVKTPAFKRFRFFDRRHGWGVTDSAVLYYSDDGGQQWQRWSQDPADWVQLVSTVNRAGDLFLKADKSAVAALLPLDAQRVLINRRDVIASADSGDRRWRSLTRPVFSYADNVGNAGACQLVLGTALLCGSEDWSFYPLGTGGRVVAFHFPDKRNGWVATAAGKLLSTQDIGRHWQQHRQSPGETVLDMQFADTANGWLVGEFNVYRTTDGGANWSRANPCANCRFQRVHFVSPGVGWLFGRELVYRTADGGNTWQRQVLPAGANIAGGAFIDADSGWLVGARGQIFATADGGASWQLQNSKTTADLLAAAFVDKQMGWAVGEQGALLATTNGGQSWKKLQGLTDDSLLAITFHDPAHGAIFGRGGPVLRSADGGKTWLPIAYRRYPAPWYYTALAAALALLLPALRKPLPQKTGRDSIADLLASDAPLKPEDPDPLGYGRIARTLSNFIRNRNTTPPLTIAVTGRWGSGKSSLMNLLQHDLERYGYPCVWFNAWHHQKEEHLLASLLAAVRTQSVPKLIVGRFPFINPDWFSFRYGLLVMRGPHYWLTALFVLFLVVVSAMFVAENPQTLDQRLKDLLQLLPWIGEGPPAPGTSAAATGSESTLQVLWQNRDLVGLLTTLSLAAAGVIKTLRAFGVSPAKLLPAINGVPARSNLESRLDFRHYFAQEFREVTKAIAPQRMVIFIDDLDRCRHGHVLEVLEAINFLVSSGDCIVVLGMDYSVVTQSVALEYQDLAKLLAAAGESGSRAQNASEFAEEYLEKLLNIQIPVPELEVGQGEVIMAPPPRPHSQWRRWRRRLLGATRILSPVLLVVLAIVLGALAGDVLVRIPNSAQLNGTDKAAAAPVAGGQTVAVRPQTRVAAVQPEPEQPAVEAEPSGAALFIQESQVRAHWYAYVWGPALILLAVGVVVVLRRRDVITDDSDTFKDALQIWSGVIQQRRNTPRAVKRYLNRSRYLAVRLREEEVVADARAHYDKTAPDRAPLAAVLDEQTLVALSALHHLDPDWLARDMAEGGASAAVTAAIAAHRGKFQQWPPSAEQIAQFRVMTAGIKT